MVRQSLCLLLLAGFLTGCAHAPQVSLPPSSPHSTWEHKNSTGSVAGGSLKGQDAERGNGSIRQASYEPNQEGATEQPPQSDADTQNQDDQPLHRPATLPEESLVPQPTDMLFAGKAELPIDTLVQAVLARNPTLAQMMATWRAVQARYPQAISLDDPLLQGGATPSIFGGEHLHGGWLASLSQKYPWPGKLRLRGENVQAQARAAANDVDDIRLQLIESAKIAFYDYYWVARAIEVNNENLSLLRQFRSDAEHRYTNGKAPQQDILQADVEIGRQEKRNFTLERYRLVAVARINTLLNRNPDMPLPLPPKEIDILDGLPDIAQLRSAALSRRPDLRALANRIQAEEKALALAYKEFYPDFDVLGIYNTLWQPGLQQPMLGVRMNLPVRLARRRAAVWEAKSKIAERRAELERQVNEMNYEINQAYAEVMENKKAGQLYKQKVVPAADLNVQSAEASYQTGQIPFLTLVEAERDVIRLKDDYYQFVAEYYRRLATLERVAGGSLALADGADANPNGDPCSACCP